MRVLVLSDTHVPDGRGLALDERVLTAAANVDVILHAGDVTGPELLAHLGTLAPVHAVLGNNDHALIGVLPEELTIDLDGLTVVLVHDTGVRAGRPDRMARRHPGADLVVFGHSHEPEDATAADGTRIFNPGSPTQRRRAPVRTFGLLDVRRGRIHDLSVVPLG